MKKTYNKENKINTINHIEDEKDGNNIDNFEDIDIDDNISNIRYLYCSILIFKITLTFILLLLSFTAPG